VLRRKGAVPDDPFSLDHFPARQKGGIQLPLFYA
jgi:hypothetical protein